MNLIDYIKERKLLDKLNTRSIHRNYNAIRSIYKKTTIDHAPLTLDSFVKCMEFLDQEIEITNSKLEKLFYKEIQPSRLAQSYNNYEEKKHMDVKIIPDDYWEDELKEAVMLRIKKYINYFHISHIS